MSTFHRLTGHQNHTISIRCFKCKFYLITLLSSIIWILSNVKSRVLDLKKTQIIKTCISLQSVQDRHEKSNWRHSEQFTSNTGTETYTTLQHMQTICTTTSLDYLQGCLSCETSTEGLPGGLILSVPSTHHAHHPSLFHSRLITFLLCKSFTP